MVKLWGYNAKLMKTNKINNKINNNINNGLIVGVNNGVINYSAVSIKEIELIVNTILLPYLNVFTEEGKKIAKERSIDAFKNAIKSCERKNVDIKKLSSNFNDPSLQMDYIKYTEQIVKNYNDNNLRVLSGIMASRINFGDQSLYQIVLSESINVACKLTKKQMALLAIKLMVSNIIEKPIDNEKDLIDYFDKLMELYNDCLDISWADIQHIDFSGCIINILNSSTFSESFINDSNCNLFFKDNKKKTNADFIKIYPKLDKLISFWEEFNLSNMRCTTIGLCVASEYIECVLNVKLDLKGWIK